MKFIMDSLSHQEEIQSRTNGNKHHQCQHEILLDASRLDDPQPISRPVSDFCRTVAEEAIDDGQIEVIADAETNPIRERAEDVQNAIDHALVQELVDDIFCEPVGWLDKHTIVEFVKIVLILEQWDLESVFCRRIDIAIGNPAKVQTTQRHNERS